MLLYAVHLHRRRWVGGMGELKPLRIFENFLRDEQIKKFSKSFLCYYMHCNL